MSQYNGMQTFLDNAPAPFEMGEYVDYTTQVKKTIPKIVWVGIILIVGFLLLKGK